MTPPQLVDDDRSFGELVATLCELGAGDDYALDTEFHRERTYWPRLALIQLAWDDELVSHPPVYENGHLVMPDRPGWGTEPNEEAIRARPPKASGGMLNYGRKG